MPDISFTSFNPRSFEQFAQALTGRVLGPGLLVFGDGPDGGREASFEGKVPYPSAVENWDGLIIMQAKFRLHPTGDGKDASWLVDQIAAEAEKFSNTDNPAYYIVVTNIRLSGVRGKERKGGQQKLDEAFERYLKPRGVEVMHVWHEEKIASLLDAEPDLLRSYGAWLSPREVLAAVFDSLTANSPDFGSTMRRLLMREMREQRATRLQQAGHAEDAMTPLERVFVDLPYSIPLRGAEERLELLQRLNGVPGTSDLLADLLALTSLKLDPKTVAATFPEDGNPPPVRHLVLGGPGQGKSTISQFLAQVARARLLHDEPRENLTAEVRPVLEAICTRMEDLGIPMAGPRRYPLRVELPAFADALAKAELNGETLSLLEYMAARIAIAANTAMNAAVMRQWLKSYPWLLILDGLDEVPPSGNRTRLLAAITDFWDEATPVGADVAMVITTRPQGYNDDLDPSYYMRHEMEKLDAKRALEYAKGVATLKIQDEARRDLVVERLQIAAANATTALLMTSPLQVAILLQLVDQRGSAPTDRWTLFDEYRGVVIKREQEKPGEAGRVVKERAFVIDGMLRRAGLLLHVEAERRGRADAYLTIERLHLLARDILQEDGHRDEVLDVYAAEITTAATDRLVFLEQRVEGRVEFEVRSLQEFMAAAELMAGEDAAVQDRLKAIAGRNHWQHVYRIAASKAFSARDAAKFRDTIVTANLLLESADPAGHATHRGGALALELLADGVAYDQPKFRRALIQQALGLLKLGPQSLDHRFPDVLAAGSICDALDLLAPRLFTSRRDERLAAWEVLFQLVDSHGDAADLLAKNSWPLDQALRLEIAVGTEPPPQGTESALLTQTVFYDAEIEKIGEAFKSAAQAGLHDRRDIVDRLPCLAIFSGEKAVQFDVGLLESEDPTLRVGLTSIYQRGDSIYHKIPDTNYWSLIAPIAQFVEDPSTPRLIEFIETLRQPSVRAAMDYVVLPWPLDTALIMLRAGADTTHLVDAISRGEFGELEDWVAAEKRWRSEGITQYDLDLWCEGKFFDGRVASVGAPYVRHLKLVVGRDERGRWLSRLLQKLLVAEPKAPASAMRSIARFSLGVQKLESPISTEQFQAVIKKDALVRERVNVEIFDSVSQKTLSDSHILNSLARIGEEDGFESDGHASSLSLASVKEMFKSAPNCGIANLIVSLFAFDRKKLRDCSNEIAGELSNLKPAEGTAAILLLQYLAGFIPVNEVLSSLRWDDGLTTQFALLSLAQDSFCDEPEDILVAISNNLHHGSSEVRQEALTQLRRLLDSRTSELDDPSVWKRLGLPPELFKMIRPEAAGPP